jgi:hypothetical protein
VVRIGAVKRRIVTLAVRERGETQGGIFDFGKEIVKTPKNLTSLKMGICIG